MKKLLAVIATVFFLGGVAIGLVVLPTTPAFGALFKKPTRISMDLGGSLLQYITDYSAARQERTRYVIDGLCVSACTLITGEIPTERICVTPFAKLAFHAAFMSNSIEGRVFSPEGTELLWRIYPKWVQQFLRGHGWADPTQDQPTLIWMEAKDLQAVYKACPT